MGSLYIESLQFIKAKECYFFLNGAAVNEVNRTDKGNVNTETGFHTKEAGDKKN